MTSFKLSISVIAAAILFLTPAIGQVPGLVAWYSFDRCDASDDTGNAPDGVVTGTPECGCGVLNNALYLDGVDDYIEFLGNLELLLSEQFTAMFYISPENLSGTVDLFSKREQCAPDSAVAVRLEPALRRVRAELTEGINERSETEGQLPTGRCWYHLAWVRSAAQLLLYIDGIVVDQAPISPELAAQNNGIFSLANSPCLANNEERYQGAIDDLRLFNRALSTTEINSLIVPFDLIENRDKVIFRGDAVQVLQPNSCAMDFAWIPVDGVNDPSLQEPVMTPEVTTTYRTFMNYDHCIATDTFQIIVVDPEDLSCEDIFLPKAFTPNGDGLNDVYGISNANFFLGEFVSLQIYDRWGGKIFEMFDIDQGWDGTVKGEFAMPGMYVYRVEYECNGETRVETASFNLLN